MRPDDLLFVVVGIVPGAVIGGRIGAVLAHADFYRSHLGSILDPGQGTLTLSLAVAGGTISGAIVARLLGTPVRAWLHIAAMPVLFGIAFGKLAMVLSGAGQGVPSELAWATAYLGPGPWSTLAPEIPSNPSQVYEAIVALAVLALIAIAFSFDVFREPTGRALLVGIAIWAFGRAIVGMVWRDAGRSRSVRRRAAADAGSRHRLPRPGLRPRAPAVPADQLLPQATQQSVPDWPDPFDAAALLTTAYPRGSTIRVRTPPRAAWQERIAMTQIAEPGTTRDEAPPAGRISHWINGRVVAGTSGREGPVYNPATGAVAKHVDFASVEEVGAAVAAAKAAFPAWRATSLSKRTDIMFRVRNLVEQHRKEIAALPDRRARQGPLGRAG